MVYLSTKSKSFVWDSNPYRILHTNWETAVSIAKRMSSLYRTEVRLAEAKFSCDPYRLSGSYIMERRV